MRARSAMPMLALALLAGCGERGPPRRADTPEEAACRSEARRSDAVTALLRQVNVSDNSNQQRVQGEIRLAVLRGMRDCLRRRGLPLPGGVEAEGAGAS